MAAKESNSFDLTGDRSLDDADEMEDEDDDDDPISWPWIQPTQGIWICHAFAGCHWIDPVGSAW
jgi:hypothetical protein